jgi:2-keto-4-pentenoate hydratase
LYGWKLGLAAPATRAALGIPAPLLGFLLEENVTMSGATIPLTDMADPKAEPELAVRLSRDLRGDEADDAILAAVASVALAIEVVDVSPPTSRLDEILACDIFQRAVVLGAEISTDRPDPDVGEVEVEVGGKLVRSTDTPTAMTGELVPMLRHTARWLTAAGRSFTAGQIVLLGSTVTPIDLRAGDDLTYRRTRFEPLEVGFG